MKSTFFSEMEAFVDAQPLYQSWMEDPPLEEELKISLTKQDLIALDIPIHTLPQIHRGLPRLYCQSEPHRSQITPPFRSLPDLKRHYIDRALLSLYTDLIPPMDAKVVLFTWVIADGLGDYLAQIQTATTLRAAYPHLTLTLITLAHVQQQLPPVAQDWEQHIFRFSGPLNGWIIHETFSEEAMQRLKGADLILEIPTVFPHMETIKEKLPPTIPFERIGEYGVVDAPSYHPATGARCMGLHFLEKGLFIKTPPPGLPEFPPVIAQLLPKEEHTFNFAYTKTFRGTYLYLHTLLSSLKNDSRTACLCFPNIEMLSHVIEKKMKDTPCLASWNIAEVEICYRHHLVRIPVGKTGKKVRLIHYACIPHEEFRKLMALSQHLIGCTGDQSVLEAVATGLPFFYDPPPYKRPFLKDLLALAEQRIPGPLADFFRLSLKNPHLPIGEMRNGWVTEEQLHISSDLLSLTEGTDEQIGDALGTLLADPALKQGFRTLKNLLADEYGFEPTLKGIVNRALLHRKRPDLAGLEWKELDAFVTGKQSGRDTLDKIRPGIQSAH